MTGIYYDPLFLQHDTGRGHPEHAGRVDAIVERLSDDDAMKSSFVEISRPAEIHEIATVHDEAYIRSTLAQCRKGTGMLDADTIISPKSGDAALLAAGGVIEATSAVFDGIYRNAHCIVRPPGHHAEADRAMGFCLFNNVAVAARNLIVKKRVERVLIVDWDVHHGNGTQNSFYEDDQVYFLSLHQWPFYPGTGLKTDIGINKGRNYTMNVPFAANTPADVYREKFFKATDEVFSFFKPEFVLVSAGFDAHLMDPLGQLELRSTDFAEMTRHLMNLAEVFCGHRLVSVLEGGYNTEHLANSVYRHVQELMKT